MTGMDSIIPAAVVTTLSAVNAAIASAKNARDIAKQSESADVKNAVIEVYDAVLELKNRILELDEENRNLKVKLAQKDSVKRTSEFGYYFKDGEPDDPLCPKCFEGEGKLAYLTRQRSVSNGRLRNCLQCKESYWELPARQSVDYPPRGEWG